jgi:hypothetical protein
MTPAEISLARSAANDAVSQLQGRSIPLERLIVFLDSDAYRHAVDLIDGPRLNVAARMYELGRMAGKAEALAERVRQVCES